MMDDYGDDLPAGDLQDEYEALADATEVMREVMGLVEELRGSTKKLGDAIASSGFPAREWVGPDAALGLLGEPFPDITLDAFLTRLAEFSAGMGPAWLRAGETEIAQFNDETLILNDVAQPLRVFAQRQRVLPARERGELPLERVFGDGRVGTQLDLLAGYLRDLESLAPYIVPLTPSEWAALLPAQPPSAMPPAPAQPEPARGATSGVLTGDQQHWLLSSQKQPAVSPYAPPQKSSVADAPQTYTRLRDFAPPSATGRPAADPRHVVLHVPNGRGLLKLLQRHQWAVLGILVLVLSAGTGLLSLVALHNNATTPTAILAASPTNLSLTCTGRRSATTLTLLDKGKTPLTWTVNPPAGLRISAMQGKLKPGASVSLTVAATNRSASKGALAIATDDGTLTVPYVITC